MRIRYVNERKQSPNPNTIFNDKDQTCLYPIQPIKFELKYLKYVLVEQIIDGKESGNIFHYPTSPELFI